MKKEDEPSPRKVLSDNLKTLKAARPGLDTIEKIVAHSGGQLTNGTVGRIHAGSHPTDVDTLQALAKVFGLKPWQLLVENLNPEALPQIADAAFVRRLKDLLRMDEASERKTAAAEPAHPLETQSPSKKMAPALAKVLNEQGKNKRGAGSKSGGVQKPRTRRSA